MSTKSLRVVRKGEQGWTNGGKNPAPTTPSTTSSPTVSPQNAQTIQPSPIPKAPPMPGLSPVQQQISNAHSLLERSEGRSGTNGVIKPYGAHARKEHVGRKGSELESRKKKKDGAYLNAYEQDKSLAMAMSTEQGKEMWNESNVEGGKFGTFDQPKLTPWMTSPIVRNVEMVKKKGKNGKPEYEHFNAKVNQASGKFTLDTGMNEGRRVQTLFGTGLERLPKPLPGGQVPKSKVKLGSVTNPNNRKALRKVKSPYKDKNAKLSVASDTIEMPTPTVDPQTTAPVQHQPVGESTNAPSPTPITSDEGSSVSSDTNESEVVSDTEGGGTEVGGVPSEGVSTDKQVESGGQTETVTPTTVTVPKTKAVVHQPGKKKFKKKSRRKHKQKKGENN